MENQKIFIDTFIQQRLEIAMVTDPNIANHHLMSLSQFLNNVVTPQCVRIAHDWNVVETMKLAFNHDTSEGAACDKKKLSGYDSPRGRALLATVASLANSLTIYLQTHSNLNSDLLDIHTENTANAIGNGVEGFTFVWRNCAEVAKVYIATRNDDTAKAVFVALAEVLVSVMMQLVNFATIAEASGREDTFPATVFNSLNEPKLDLTSMESYCNDPFNISDLMVSVNIVNHINTIAGKSPEPKSDVVTPEQIKRMTYDSLVQIPIVISELREGIASLKAGRVSPYNHSGFRDDVQDIRFTAAGGLGYIPLPNLTQKKYFEQICNDVLDINHFPDVSRIIFLLESFCMELEATKSNLDNWDNTKGLEALHSVYYNLYMVISAIGRLYGYDVYSDWTAVCNSNYTKFDREFEDIGPSCKKYVKQGIVVLPTLSPCGEYYAYIVPYDQCVDGKHYPQGKYLKSHKFQEPDYNHPKVGAIQPTAVG